MVIVYLFGHPLMLRLVEVPGACEGLAAAHLSLATCDLEDATKPPFSQEVADKYVAPTTTSSSLHISSTAT